MIYVLIGLVAAALVVAVASVLLVRRLPDEPASLDELEERRRRREQLHGSVSNVRPAETPKRVDPDDWFVEDWR